MLTRRQLNALLAAGVARAASPRLKVLIIDGRNNHDWRATSPVLRQLLEETTLFSCQFATAPAENNQMGSFLPAFGSCDVIILNYSDLGNGGEWSEAAKAAFLAAVRGGTGVVVYHAASSAFSAWKEYNRVSGLGGWGDRNERCGPYLRFSRNFRATLATIGPELRR